MITYFGCWENTRKACKSLAFGSWFTSFSRVLPTFRVGYHAGKPIESVVYILNKLWSFNDSIFPYLSLPRFSIRACTGSCPFSNTVVPTLIFVIDTAVALFGLVGAIIGCHFSVLALIAEYQKHELWRNCVQSFSLTYPIRKKLSASYKGVYNIFLTKQLQVPTGNNFAAENEPKQTSR